jgi:hypothetical protein
MRYSAHVYISVPSSGRKKSDIYTFCSELKHLTSWTEAKESPMNIRHAFKTSYCSTALKRHALISL